MEQYLGKCEHVPILQGSHASLNFLESSGFFFVKIPETGKSWKITLVLESPGKIYLKVMHLSSG